MIKKLISLVVFILPLYVYGQMVYNFDVEPDTSFWDFETLKLCFWILGNWNFEI